MVELKYRSQVRGHRSVATSQVTGQVIDVAVVTWAYGSYEASCSFPFPFASI